VCGYLTVKDEKEVESAPLFFEGVNQLLKTFPCEVTTAEGVDDKKTRNRRREEQTCRGLLVCNGSATILQLGFVGRILIFFQLTGKEEK
jgi:hypothetical protein